jgi:integrase
MLLCDTPGCENGIHTTCMSPPLRAVPQGDFFCPACRSNAPRCGECAEPTTQSTRVPRLQCSTCGQHFHRECLGLHAAACLAGEFVCAPCTLLAAKVGVHSDKALEAASTLVYLKASAQKGSSLDAYATALHRYTNCMATQFGLQVHEALPRGPGAVVPTQQIELFLGWAARKYKHSTIQATLNALAHWHTSKQCTPDTVRTPSISLIMKSIAREQGPEGVPLGKKGMSKPILRLLLAKLSTRRRSDPAMRDIYVRDAAWLVLGYYGMLRRSELIALRVGDITFGCAPTPYVRLHIARSKTDPRGCGADVYIHADTRDGVPISTFVRRLVDARLKAGATPQDPLLTQWDLDARTLSSTPIANGQALAKRLSGYLRELASEHPTLRLHPESYGMHSLRRGGATAAWEGGASREKIMAHGRWTSAAVDKYLMATLAVKLSVTDHM